MLSLPIENSEKNRSGDRAAGGRRGSSDRVQERMILFLEQWVVCTLWKALVKAAGVLSTWYGIIHWEESLSWSAGCVILGFLAACGFHF